MISWLQRSFQQHFRVIFSVLLAVIVISFIFTIGSTPGVGRGERGSATRDFFGHNLVSQEEMQSLLEDAHVSAELQYGESGVDEDQIQRYAFQRIAALHLADQLGIPGASVSQIRTYIEGMRAFADDKGAFDPSRYEAFRTSLKTNSRTSEGDIARVLSDDVRIEEVEKLIAGPGYVLRADVKEQLAESDSKWTIDTATVDYAAYTPAIDPDDVQLLKFFSDNSFRYQIPPRASVEAVEFPATAFIGDVSVTDADVRAYYDQNPARFPKPATTKAATPPPKPNPAADFAAVRPAVEASLKFDRARSLAAKAASDLAYQIYDGKIVRGPALDSFLAAHRLAAKPLAPFTKEAGPAEYGGSKEIAESAFKLDSDRYYSEALPTPTGSVIILWKDNLPARQPALAEVRAKVRADFIEGEKRKDFVELGSKLKKAIEGRLKAGDSFEKAAASAGAAASVKIEVKALPPFTFRDRPKEVDSTVAGTLERLERGQISDMAITADKGLFVYAADRKVPDLSEANPRYAELRTQMASYSSRLGSGAALSELVDTELKRTAPAAPDAR